MTSIFEHAEYAEDQKYGKTILTFHVLRAGAAAGAIVSIPIALGFFAIRKPRTASTLARTLLVSSSRGVAIGTVGSGVALVARMWGREDIEWQDRSWRLLANHGQVEVDNWILEGAAVGMIGALALQRTGRLPLGIERQIGTTLLGGVGLGMTSATAGYMIWRYGVHKGKFE